MGFFFLLSLKSESEIILKIIDFQGWWGVKKIFVRGRKLLFLFGLESIHS